MKLADLTLPISYADAVGLALVFGTNLARRLAEVWRQCGSTNCVPVPLQMTDGRWMLSADVLTEIGEGGLLHAMWASVDQAAVFAEVEVMPWADAVALLPEQDNAP